MLHNVSNTIHRILRRHPIHPNTAAQTWKTISPANKSSLQQSVSWGFSVAGCCRSCGHTLNVTIKSTFPHLLGPSSRVFLRLPATTFNGMPLASDVQNNKKTNTLLVQIQAWRPPLVSASSGDRLVVLQGLGLWGRKKRWDASLLSILQHPSRTWILGIFMLFQPSSLKRWPTIHVRGVAFIQSLHVDT